MVTSSSSPARTTSQIVTTAALAAPHVLSLATHCSFKTELQLEPGLWFQLPSAEGVQISAGEGLIGFLSPTPGSVCDTALCLLGLSSITLIHASFILHCAQESSLQHMEGLATEVLAQIVDLLDPEDVAHLIGTCNIRLVLVLRSQRSLESMRFATEGRFPQFVRHFKHLRALSFANLHDPPFLQKVSDISMVYPPNLTELVITNAKQSDAYKFVPLGLPSLTRLELTHVYRIKKELATSVDYLFNSLHRLPALQSLTLDGRSLKEEHVAKLPANLESFTFWSLKQVADVVDVVATLPRSLKAFWLHQPPSENAAYKATLLRALDHLPPGLTSFSAHTFLSSDAQPSDIAKLPRGLTDLYLELEPDFVPLLPPDLKKLRISCYMDAFNGGVCLPSSLTQLSVIGNYDNSVFDCLARSFLPSLTRLSFATRNECTYDYHATVLPPSLTDLELLAQAREDDFSRLTNLRRLKCTIYDNDTTLKDFVTSLPVSLTYLELQSCPEVTEDDLLNTDLLLNVGHLVSLRSLIVGFMQGLLTDEHIVSLPKSLTHLRLTHADNPELPDNISHVCITMKGWLAMPKLLRHLTLSLPGHHTWEPPPNLPYLMEYNVIED